MCAGRFGLTLKTWMLRTAMLFAACTFIGCRSDGELLVPVEGTVTLNGTPLSDGAVSFRAAPGNPTLHQPTGPIDSDGRYRLFVGRREGVPPGEYKVVVFANEPMVHDPSNVHPQMPKTLIDRRYNAPETTPLSVEVSADLERATFDFDLDPAA